MVTEDLRQWARTTLQDENAIEGVKGKNTLSIRYVQNKTGRPELDTVQKGLTLMLITDLSTLEGLRIVERTRFQALTGEMGLGAVREFKKQPEGGVTLIGFAMRDAEADFPEVKSGCHYRGMSLVLHISSRFSGI